MWTRRLLLFAAGLGLFLSVRAGWGDEGVLIGRIIAVAILVLVFAGLLFVYLRGRRRPASGGVADVAGLIRLGRTDEAVRRGRELFDKSPGDPQAAWYLTAALMKSGHVAEARRVFGGLKRESLPPKMAAMYDRVRKALETGAQSP